MARGLGLPLVSIANTASVASTMGAVTGGSIMVDSKGRCFAAPSVPDDSWHCSEVISFRSLPLDGTGHIDLFAKLLAADVAVVADFDEGIEFAEEPFVTTELCSSVTGDCKTTEFSPAFPPKLLSDANGNKSILSIAELKTRLDARYGKNQVDWPSSGSKQPDWTEFNLREFSNATAAKFTDRGIRVVKIKNPRPIAYVQITRLVNESGK